MANEIEALRTRLKPMRVIAARRSAIGLPTVPSAAELAIWMMRAASAASEPTTRTIACEVTSSASTLRTRMATSGKLGSSISRRDSPCASSCTN
ncbi:MAG: hypothetical protein U1F11_14180 [Steroidobacteraceae bacterium]